MSTTSVEVLEARIAPAVLFAVESSTTANKLVSFDSAAPGTLLSDVTITGIQASEEIAGIDFNPRDGQLYALGLLVSGGSKTGRIYTIDTTSGAATLFDTISSTLANTAVYSIDFNAQGRIEIINGADNHYMYSANGSATLTDIDDSALDRTIAGIASNHNFNSTTSTLYAYDFLNDDLLTINANGTFVKVGDVKLNGNAFSADVSALGFDIAGPLDGPEVGYVNLRDNSPCRLFTFDLTTAALTDLGQIGTGARNFSGLAVKLDAPAPTIAADGKTATWTDLDGDTVTLKVSTGGLTADKFRMLLGTKGVALAKLDLTAANFSGATVSLTAKPGTSGGDGRVNIGGIDATGRDLGTVTVPGDLVQLLAGDGTKPSPSVKLLKAGSIAAFGDGLNGGPGSVTLADGAGSIIVAGDMGGTIQLGAAGKTGSLTIGGDVVGANGGDHGKVRNSGSATVGKVVISGSVKADDSGDVGQVFLRGVGSLTIGGSIKGGASNNSGAVDITGTGKTQVTIGGSIIGGGLGASGDAILRNVATVKVGGSLIGGTSSSTGTLSVTGTVSVTVKGDLIGGTGFYSGSITGSTTDTFIKSLTIGGSLSSDPNQSLQLDLNRVGSITIGGSVNGEPGAPVIIAVAGMVNPTTAAQSLAIGKITIAGSLSRGIIIAGSTSFFSEKTPDASIGMVKIGKDMEASSIAAGIAPKSGGFGDWDDSLATGSKGSTTILASIAKITIGGQLYGTLGGDVDTFGIEAESIGAISVGTTALKLKTGPSNDNFTTGFTSDVMVREF